MTEKELSAHEEFAIWDELIHIWTIMDDVREQRHPSSPVIRDAIRSAKVILKAAGYEVVPKP